LYIHIDLVVVSLTRVFCLWSLDFYGFSLGEN